MGFNGIIWWRSKKPQKKKKKKSKPKKVKVFWHKDPISIDSSEESRELILDTSLTDAAFKLCSLKDPPSSYKRASTSTTFGTSSTTLDTPLDTPPDSCVYCGVHYNTELSLLSHVRSSVLNFDVDIDGLGEGQHIRPRSDVLHAIDTFCISRHWMEHIGPEKGNILLSALRQCMFRKRALLCTSWDYYQDTIDSTNNNSNNNFGQFIAVELGTYCGYASILMGRLMHQTKNAIMDTHLFSLELNSDYIDIATEMISMAGMDDVISVHQVSRYNNNPGWELDTDLVCVLKGVMQERYGKHQYEDTKVMPKIDFLFIDHDKDAYLSDLIKLQNAGLIGKGTKVVADDVLFVDIEDYVVYIQQLKNDGIVKTKTVPCKAVEYCGEREALDMSAYQDGLEITDYLEDPPVD